MARRALPVVLLTGLVSLAAACDSPTLPLPPPSLIPTQTAGVDADHVTLNAACGSVYADVYVQILNLGHSGGAPIPNMDVGVVVAATSCGAYTASVYGHYDDLLEITQEEGITVSTPQWVTIGMQ
jgi:hypothetical protein